MKLRLHNWPSVREMSNWEVGTTPNINFKHPMTWNWVTKSETHT